MIDFLLHHTPLLYAIQSLWRDEAFSILVAEKPLSFIYLHLGFEPPVYYTLLHFWMKIFGQSEIAARSLSLVGFVLATYVIIVWSEKLFKKHWLSWFLPVFFFLNPMLLYYAFEVRTYAWYTFFAVASMYLYTQKNWPWYVAASVLGFYTHDYMIVLIFAQGVHWLFVDYGIHNIRRIKKLVVQPMFRSFAAVGILTAPWLVKIALEAHRLKSSWYFPVNFQLVGSVLGNMFLGYEGTPWYLWKYTPYLSAILLTLFILALLPKATRKRNLFLFFAALIPLVVIVGISFAKPLFVNRYLVPVSAAEVLLVGLGIASMRRRAIQALVAVLFLAFVVWFNLWYPPQHAKLDIRTSMLQVNALRGKQDVVFAESPLIFFESIYYSSDRNKVFLYNPGGSPFPWYVGDVIVSPSQMAKDLPTYPSRAFLIHENGTFDIVYNVRVSFIPQPVTTKSSKTL